MHLIRKWISEKLFMSTDDFLAVINRNYETDKDCPNHETDKDCPTHETQKLSLRAIQTA